MRPRPLGSGGQGGQNRVQMFPPTPSVLRLTCVFGTASFSGALAIRALDPAAAELGLEFSVSADRIALLSTAFSLPFALIQPVLGSVADATGKRRMVALALIVLALMLTLCAMAPTVGWLMVARILAGAAAGGVMPVTIAIIGDAVPMAQRQVAISRLLVFAITGQIAGGALAGFLMGFVGWRGVILGCAGVALAAGVFVLNEAWRGGMREARGRFDPVVALKRYRSIIGNPAARFLYIMVAIEGALIYGIFPYVAPLLLERGLGGVAESGLAIGGFGVGGIVFAIIAPPILRRAGQGPMVMMGGALCLIGLAGFGTAPSLAIAIGSMLVLGVGFYMIHNSIQTRVSEVAPQSRASAVSLHAFSFFSGQSLGPILYGVALGGLGAPVTLVMAGLGLVVLAILIGRRPG
jgi:predicted MFS family arabinose efflux permease